MTETSPFAALLAAANAGSTPALPANGRLRHARYGATPGSMRGLLEAAFAWELSTGRLARPDDEPLIRERRALMEAATAAAVPIAILQDAGTPCYVTVAGQVPLFGLRVEAG